MNFAYAGEMPGTRTAPTLMGQLCARRPEGDTAPERTSQIALPPSQPGRHAASTAAARASSAPLLAKADTVEPP